MRLFSLHLLQFSPSASFTFLAPFLCPSSAAQRSGAPWPAGPLLSSIYLQADSWTESAALATFPLLLFPSAIFKGKKKGAQSFFYY